MSFPPDEYSTLWLSNLQLASVSSLLSACAAIAHGGFAAASAAASAAAAAPGIAAQPVNITSTNGTAVASESTGASMVER